MTEFTKAVAGCIANWGRIVTECNGDNACLEEASRGLRQCLDKAFPDSKVLDLQGDKVNYMLSSMFFLANRLAKASQGLAEFDKLISTTGELSRNEGKDSARQGKFAEFNKELDEILAKYF
jgi:hypothetical protein